MDEQNAPLIQSMIQEWNPAVADTVIQVGGVETMLRVKECLDRGGIVGVMGDRVTQEEQTVGCHFFGREAKFPAGAMRLAHVVRAPIVLVFGVYRGGNRYEVYLESFSDWSPVSRDRRDADLINDVQRYAIRLDEMCRRAPDNWFNFYDFWDEFR